MNRDASLRANDPDMTFELTTLHSADVSRALLEREADLCLGFEAPEGYLPSLLADG